MPNFAEGGTAGESKNRIVPSHLTSHLKSSSLPIRKAFKREGNQGVLAVFTPGEEILSLRTGEAQRYQSLKRELGNNPLRSIFAGNFSNGGTIESNILSGISRPHFRFDASSLSQKNRDGVKPSQIINVSPTFVTPDADSFRASEYQPQRDLAETVGRASRR